MPIISTTDSSRLGITPVDGVRTGIVVPPDGEPSLLIQFKRADGTSTPSYTMSPDGALNLIESLSKKLHVLANPEKFAAFVADKAGTDDHNPPAT